MNFTAQELRWECFGWCANLDNVCTSWCLYGQDVFIFVLPSAPVHLVRKSTTAAEQYLLMMLGQNLTVMKTCT